jgi:hypothetical protein
MMATTDFGTDRGALTRAWAEDTHWQVQRLDAMWHERWIIEVKEGGGFYVVARDPGEGRARRRSFARCGGWFVRGVPSGRVLRCATVAAALGTSLIAGKLP